MTRLAPTITGLTLITLFLLPLTAGAQEQGDVLNWIEGPAICPVGGVAEIDLPEGFQFIDGDGTRQIMEWLENPTSGRELGMVMPLPTEESGLDWFVVFEYDPIGYVRDDEKDKLDADAILKSISEGTEAANEIRRERGWEEVHVVGWQTPPFYDENTNNLTWAIIGGSDSGRSVNLSTRLLSRGGAMSADLIVVPEDLDLALGGYGTLISRFRFTQGHRYAEFREGDKVAKYGLTALVAGGAGAVAMKTGILARLWKFIVIGFLAVVSFLRRTVGKLFGRGEKPQPAVGPREEILIETKPDPVDPPE